MFEASAVRKAFRLMNTRENLCLEYNVIDIFKP